MGNYAIVLAAGKGTRMKSAKHKVLHEVAGTPMLEHVLREAEDTNFDRIVTVVGYQAKEVMEQIGSDKTEYVEQAHQLGTAHAVMQAQKLLGNDPGVTVVLSGDTPLIKKMTIFNLFKFHKESGSKATILTAFMDNPTGYGRVIRNVDGSVNRIVEEKDATAEEKQIKEVNTGIYAFDNEALNEALGQVTNDNAQGEYYLPDVFEILSEANEPIEAYPMEDSTESTGVNDQAALAKVNELYRMRINEGYMNDGVIMIDPKNVYIEGPVEIGQDTVIEPNVTLRGNTKIGANCRITMGSVIQNSKIADNVTVTSSALEDATMESGSNIGPNSHLRPKAFIGESVHIGNFCEIKNATIGKGTKVGHLSYVGDATLGENINIGCGTVFVNYDGKQKFHSTVGDDSFIGSGSNIIAPVTLGPHTIVAAGSTITDNINEYDMGIARSRQVNKEGYYHRSPLADDEK